MDIIKNSNKQINIIKMVKYVIIIIAIIVLIYYTYYICNTILNTQAQYFKKYNYKSLEIVNKFKIPDIEYSKKSNVIIFFSVDYKILPNYFNIVYKMYSEYCRIHNYTLLCFNHYEDDKDTKISPYWNRVSDLIKLSNTYDNDYIFLYVDIDTCVNPKYLYTSIENIIDTVDIIDKSISDIYIGKDSGTEANAGVIILRNSEWTKIFLNKWFLYYDNKDWIYINDKWKCIKDNKTCNWAQDSYEQGAFNTMYENNELDSKNHINILHMSIVSNQLFYKDAFIYHFFGRAPMFKPFSLSYMYMKYKLYNNNKL